MTRVEKQGKYARANDNLLDRQSIGEILFSCDINRLECSRLCK